MRFLRRVWDRIRPTPAALHVCVNAEPYNPVMLTHRFMPPPPCPCNHPPSKGLHVTDKGLVIKTPARGDALAFTVTVWCFWCAQPKAGLPDGDLRAEINAIRPAAHRLLHDVVRATARGFDADLAQQAEEAITKELTAAFLKPVHNCGNITARCSVRAWVTLGEEELEYQRGVGRNLLESRARLALTRAHVERLSGERDLWLGFLEESAKNRRSRFAVELAEHPVDMAATMGVMESERREEADRFLSLVQNVVRAQQSVNVFDLVTDSESALRVALEQLGVRLPEPSSDLPWERM